MPGGWRGLHAAVVGAGIKHRWRDTQRDLRSHTTRQPLRLRCRRESLREVLEGELAGHAPRRRCRGRAGALAERRVWLSGYSAGNRRDGHSGDRFRNQHNLCSQQIGEHRHGHVLSAAPCTGVGDWKRDIQRTRIDCGVGTRDRRRLVGGNHLFQYRTAAPKSGSRPGGREGVCRVGRTRGPGTVQRLVDQLQRLKCPAASCCVQHDAERSEWPRRRHLGGRRRSRGGQRRRRLFLDRKRRIR